MRSKHRSPDDNNGQTIDRWSLEEDEDPWPNPSPRPRARGRRNPRPNPLSTKSKRRFLSTASLSMYTVGRLCSNRRPIRRRGRRPGIAIGSDRD